MSEATYVAKFNAGGSGDNIVPDGYIKTVEKVWLDTYTMDFTLTRATIDIAVIPPNKKITSIDIDILSTYSITTGTVAVGFSTDASIDSFLTETVIINGGVDLSRTTIHLPGAWHQKATTTSSTIAWGAIAGFQKVTGGTQTTISLRLDDWVIGSVGTIRTAVRYT